MSLLANQTGPTLSNSVWQRRYFVALTTLAWIAIGGVILWFLGLIAEPIVFLIISAILGFILHPAAKKLAHFMPRPLAILTTLLLVFAVVLFILYIIGVVAMQQFIALIVLGQKLLQGPPPAFIQPAIVFLNKAGIAPSQFQLSGQQLLDYLQGFISNIGPLVGNIINLFIAVILVVSLSIYFLVDGYRVTNWLKESTPLRFREQITYFLDTAGKTMGGFIRGQLLLSVIISTLVGLGALLIGVPYAALIGVLIFVFGFIPIIGPYISGILSILIALANGWQTALLMAIIIILAQQVLEGQILSPRILGHSVGLHPIVAIFALLVGTKLFGLLGAFLAAPVAGILQSFVIAMWLTWKEEHPDQFPTRKEEQLPETEPAPLAESHGQNPMEI